MGGKIKKGKGKGMNEKDRRILRDVTEKIRSENLKQFEEHMCWWGDGYSILLYHYKVRPRQTNCDGKLTIDHVEDAAMYILLTCSKCGQEGILIRYEEFGLKSLLEVDPS